jgi:hypothetical protein
LEPEGSVGDDLVYLSPPAPARLDRMTRNGQGADCSHKQKKIVRRSFQIDDQRQIIFCFHTHLVCTATLLIVGAGSAQVIQDICHLTREPRNKGPLPGKFEIGRRDRPSIAPIHIIAKMEDVLQTVARDLPASGLIRNYGFVRAVFDQPADQVADDPLSI